MIGACAVRLAWVFPGRDAAPRRLFRVPVGARVRDALDLGLGQPDRAGAAERHRRDDRRRAPRSSRGRALRVHRKAGVGAGQPAAGDPAERRAGAERAPHDRRSRPAVPGQLGARAGDAGGERPRRLRRARRQRRVRPLVGRPRAVRRAHADAAPARGDDHPSLQHHEHLRAVLFRPRAAAGADRPRRRRRDARHQRAPGPLVRSRRRAARGDRRSGPRQRSAESRGAVA